MDEQLTPEPIPDTIPPVVPVPELTHGDTGARGHRGDTGDRGDSGSRGDAGAAGKAGATGNRGDTGPRGEPGSRGERGDRGERGESGAQWVQPILDSLSRLEENTSNISRRMDNLVETTNHRLDGFTDELKSKADTKDLAEILVKRLATSKVVTASVAILGVMFTPVVISNWTDVLDRVRPLLPF